MVYTDNLSTGALCSKNPEMVFVTEPEQNNDNEKIAKNFLDALYSRNRKEGYLVLWTKQDKRAYFFNGNNFAEASKKAIALPIVRRGRRGSLGSIFCL